MDRVFNQGVGMVLICPAYNARAIIRTLGAKSIGVPARVIGEVSEKNRDMTHWAKELYIDLAHRYPKGLREIPESGIRNQEDQGSRASAIRSIRDSGMGNSECGMKNVEEQATGNLELRKSGKGGTNAELETRNAEDLPRFDPAEGWRKPLMEGEAPAEPSLRHALPHGGSPGGLPGAKPTGSPSRPPALLSHAAASGSGSPAHSTLNPSPSTLPAGAPLVLHPIGVIHTPFREPEGTPIQGVFAPEAEGVVEVLPEFAEGLRDLEGFSHVHLIYGLDRCRAWKLTVRPYLDDREHGLFATRAPARPNPIGITVVRLLALEGSTLRVAGVDMLDGTPLFDIKPFAPSFDHREGAVGGWIEARLKAGAAGPGVRTVADGRFHTK